MEQLRTLAGKFGLITGGGTGLGREIALQLAHEGMYLAIAYSRSQADAEQVVAEIRTAGGQAAVFKRTWSRLRKRSAWFERLKSHLAASTC